MSILHFISASFSKLHAVDTENLRMLYKVSFYLGITVLFASCAGSNKVTTKKEVVQGVSGTDVCEKSLSGNKPHISWYKQTDDVFKGAENTIVLPAMHDVYGLDTQQLRTFFYAAKKEGEVETAIPLANGVGCRVFTLKTSGAMNEELRKKYPDMISLQGGESGTNNGDVRMDYNGRAIQAQIVIDGATYILKPVYVRNVYYYVMYRKNDTETQPVQEPVAPVKPQRPRQPEQIKYDR